MKPYIITHMGISVDGRIDGEHWGDIKGMEEYERTGELLEGDAWMVGRVTMELHFASKEEVKLNPPKQKIDLSDFVAAYNAEAFAIVVDAAGKLFYDDAYVDGDHIIAVLTKKVSDAYLNYLKNKNISYIFGGATEIDFEVVMEKLFNLFNIKRLLLEGGGGINGSVLKAVLVDELSVLQFPVVDGMLNTPALFDIREEVKQQPSAHLQLISVERLQHDILWLRYKVTK
ncbi:MAG: deaminase [Flavobacterium psychrophilum]|nr:MAG: deaminase [Flavobacterium psychrophilum]